MLRADDARKLLDAGVEEFRRHRLVEIADVQHFLAAVHESESGP